MTGEASARRPTVLVVDDEERILSALQRSLRREGYEIVTAESAARALAILAERPVDLVLSDQKMPGMSGLELLEEAARLRPDAALVLFTGWTQEIPQQELENLGIRALITKPWDDAALKQTLREALA